MCRLPTTILSRFIYSSKQIGFPSTKPEAQGTVPKRICRSSAPSPQNLTGKRSLTYLVAPFMVELFTARFLAESPRWSDPGSACRQTEAPHASRVEETHRNGKPQPHGRDSHPLCMSWIESIKDTRTKSYTGLVTNSVPPTRPCTSARSVRIAHILTNKCCQAPHWIERWDYSDNVASSIQRKLATIRITPTSLH